MNQFWGFPAAGQCGRWTALIEPIVDCAAAMGIRASDEKDRRAELAVTREHLEDMRRLVFADVDAAHYRPIER